MSSTTAHSGARAALRIGVFIAAAAIAAAVFFLCSSLEARKKKMSPFDVFVHDMHTPLFESVSFPCENCHADPESYGDREKINKQGCHLCHNSPTPAIPAPSDCKMCHADGVPKPQSHRSGWIAKHQSYAKTDPKSCLTCHPNQMFCIDCHGRRDTITTRMHRRNFRLFHSIDARANPRACDACHAITYCQDCHAGRGNSSK